MAIFGNLEIIRQQVSYFKLIKAIDFLSAANLEEYFADVSPGNNKTIEIEGRDIYAIFQEYDSKLPQNVKIEGHHKYIDIQYIYKGVERILLANNNDVTSPDIYNKEKDVHFPIVAGYSHIELREREGAVLFPVDLHGPCCCINQPDRVKKVVIKVICS